MTTENTKPRFTMETLKDKIDEAVDAFMYDCPRVKENFDEGLRYATIYVGEDFVAYAESWDKTLCERYPELRGTPAMGSAGGYIWMPKKVWGVLLEAAPRQLELF